MGCWNETCALSGLPIREDDECYMLEFDDVSLIACCGIENFNDYFRHLKSIEFGKYDDCGNIKRVGKAKYKQAPDGRCFILKHFWDFASKDAKARKVIKDQIKEYKERVDNIDEFLKAYGDLDSDKGETYVPGISIYKKDAKMFEGFIAVLIMMCGLRRNFYTAGYRGAQSTSYAWKTMLDMNKEAQSYLKRTISSKPSNKEVNHHA